MKIIKSPKDFSLSIKGVIQTIENDTKKQRGRLLGMLLGTLGAGLLEDILAGKEVIRPGNEVMRAGQDF